MSNLAAVQEILTSPIFQERILSTVIIEMRQGDGMLFSPRDALNNGASEWVARNREVIPGTPGFPDAVAYAILTGNNEWDSDQSVISDAMILSAIQYAQNGILSTKLQDWAQSKTLRLTRFLARSSDSADDVSEDAQTS